MVHKFYPSNFLYLRFIALFIELFIAVSDDSADTVDDKDYSSPMMLST